MRKFTSSLPPLFFFPISIVPPSTSLVQLLIPISSAIVRFFINIPVNVLSTELVFDCSN